MNPNNPQPSRDDIEVRLTALLLGELPPAEAELLRWSISQDPELAKVHDRLKSAIGLVREVAASPEETTAETSAPLKMSEERRQKLLAHFKTVTPKEFAPVAVRPLKKSHRKTSWLVPLAAVLVIGAFLAALLWPSLSAANRGARYAGGRPFATLANHSSEDNQKDMAYLAPEKSAKRPNWMEPPAMTVDTLTDGVEFASAAPEPSLLPSTPIVLPPPVTAFDNVSPALSPQPVADPASDVSFGIGGGGGGAGVSGFGGIAGHPVSSASSLASVDKSRSQEYLKTPPVFDSPQRTPGSLDINPATGMPYHEPAAGENTGLVTEKSKIENGRLADTLDSSHAIFLPPGSADSSGSLNGTTTTGKGGTSQRYLGVDTAAGTRAQSVNGISGNFTFNSPNSDQSGNSGSIGNRQNSTRQPVKSLDQDETPAVALPSLKPILLPGSSPAEMPVATGVPPSSPAPVMESAVIPIGAFPGTAAAPQLPTPSPEDVPKVEPPPETAPVPQPEVTTKENAFSTFSLNVSDVSFKLAAASLEHNVFPRPGSIRSEEFINAFDYRDPQPPAGSPVGFACERAGDPFEHNRDFLRFSIKTAAEGRAPGRPLNLVLLLDKSGSMERADRVAIIHEALRVLAAQLGPHDTFSVITFARTARLYADGVPGSQAEDVFGKLSGITPEGGTNLEEAMNLAYQTALRHYLAGGVNRVVLMTDGAANLGDVDAQHFKQKVEANRQQGIALDCFGVGWEDYNDNLLELLASHGDGRYGFLNTPEEASSGFATQLAGALKVAAADVKVQVEFNPARVTAYRQIGYASHQLTKEQFRDNSVDAAVIGAAESGNALYTVQINPQGDGPVATVRVRFRVPGTSQVQEHSWLVPYTGTVVALDQASPAMRLAATAGTFAEWLMASPALDGLNLDQLLDYLKGVPAVYGTDPRPKQLELMIRQAKNFAGKG